MSQNKSLFLTASIVELFNPLLKKAAYENRFKVSDESYAYILSLLESYMFSNQLFSEEQSSMMSERLLKALQEESSYKKEQSLKNLGDSTLFQVGFFGESLQRKIVGLSFYMQIGASAYSVLHRETENSTYEDISQRFSGYVDLFITVRKKVNFKTKENLIYLFDRYLEGGSKAAQAELLEQGVVPTPNKKISGQ